MAATQPGDTDDPGSGAFPISKSDTTVFEMTRALWVGGAGDVAVRMRDGSSATFVGVGAGTILPIRVDKVLSTGTTATSIVGII